MAVRKEFASLVENFASADRFLATILPELQYSRTKETSASLDNFINSSSSLIKAFVLLLGDVRHPPIVMSVAAIKEEKMILSLKVTK